ncbi:GNAT family N-acetyltransferase [Oscillibacter sp. MSJ-2]|uniref:GNAT family N-acetyltransferase n=1 Tax=Dysosmobacter acutus TaxID=2841504 RepID=A0ABS6F7Q5_9FIRM|nr:GNAT family N-acetyltransferase [Dysosmobacter acutus]MBU5626310.1 GNAT family N-acetyltransferase [Dysosmobacter acutus]
MIRAGREADIGPIEKIYHRILERQEAGLASVGWIRGVYPTAQTAREALAAGELFVLEEDGAVAAAARINQRQVPEYKNARWRYADAPEEQIMVLHTLVVDPERSGMGYGTEFVRFYERYALQHSCPYLRMDTNAVNAAARRLYRGLGYWEADIVPCVFNGIPDVQLVCLEKRIGQ